MFSECRNALIIDLVLCASTDRNQYTAYIHLVNKNAGESSFSLKNKHY